MTKNRSFSKKANLIVLGILGFSAVIAANFFLDDIKNFFGFGQQATGAIILPASIQVQNGQEFTVPVMISGEGVSGADIVLTFDTNFLELASINPKPENSTLQNFLPRSGETFDASRVVTQANFQGHVKFGAFSYDPLFSGSLGEGNPLALLVFRAKSSGATSLNVVFSPGSTSDANLVTWGGRDILGSTNNTSISISGAVEPSPSPLAQPSPSPTPESSPSPEVSPSPSPEVSPSPSPSLEPSPSASLEPLPSSSPSSEPQSSPSPSPRRIGDVDGDNRVGVLDLTIIINNLDTSPPGDPRANLNNDNEVDIIDLGIVIDHFDL